MKRKGTIARRSRGQALVLMGLMMLLVTLMVLMTLGISSRVKEKMEVQQVADAAAYSTAVATSRVMNSMSLLTRVHVSNMVALAANQSLISWAGLYYGVVNQFDEGVQDATCISGAAYWCPAACAAFETIKLRSSAEKARVGAIWDALDWAAAGQSTRWQKGVMDQQGDLRDELVQYVLGDHDNSMVAHIVRRASENDPHSEWTPAIASSIFEGEGGAGDGTAFRRTTSREAGTEATHGSRGDGFVTHREGGGLGAYLTALYLPAIATGLGSVEGEGWYGDEDASGAAGYGSTYGFNPKSANARDEISARLTYIVPPCIVMSVDASEPAWVFSDDRSVSMNDEHQFAGGAGADVEPPQQRHTMGMCNSCPGIWVSFLDLDLDKVVDGDTHLFGQPKAAVAIRRDYAQRDGNEDPWALDFDVTFAGVEGKNFDNRGVESDAGNFSAQIAISTALSYYHRPGDGGRRWDEPPTLFNPFWRATLVSSSISMPYPGEPDSQINQALSGLGMGDQVVNELRSAGFRGWQ